MIGRSAALTVIGTVSACCLVSCASAPPETDYRLGERQHTACHAVAVAPDQSYFAALCDVLVKEDMGGRDYNETLEIIGIPHGHLVNKTILNLVEGGVGPIKTLAEIEFSPDGSILAVATGTGIFRVLETKSLEPLGFLQTTRQKASALSFSADGEFLAVAFDLSMQDQASYVAIYRAADMQEIQRLFIATADAILSLAFSNDAKKLAVATAEQAAGWVHVYAWESDYRIDAIPHKYPVTSVLFSDEASELLTLSDDLKVFRLEQVAGEDPRYRQSSSLMAVPGLWALQETEVPIKLAVAKPLPRMKISPGGRFLAVADAEDRINLIALDPLERRCASGVAQYQPTDPYGALMIAALNPYPSDLAWSPDESLIVASFARSGLQLAGAECVRGDRVDLCAGLRIEAGIHTVEVTAEAATKLAEEMERAFFGGGLFGRGDLVSVRYRVTEYKERNTAAWIFTGFGKGKAAVSAEFFDAAGTLLLAAQADSKSNFNPEVDTFGEGMRADDRLAFRRVSEEFAAHAAMRFGCMADRTD